MTKKEQLLKAVKLYSKGKEIGSKSLEAQLNLTGFEVRDVVRELRRDGYPVCSNDKGYYYSEDPDDIKDTKNKLKSQLVSMSETIASLSCVENKYRMKQLNQGELL